jgi:thioredoxin reductase
MREADIVIVGGGPGGLAAALEAAATGAHALLIDEYSTLGGQFYKQVPAAFAVDALKSPSQQYADGAETIRKVRHTTVEVWPDTLVWGIFDNLTLAVWHDECSEPVRAKKIILAPGAQEVPVAFPGWTLPGVVMGGGVLNMLVNQHLLPGRKVVLAGAGPLQLKVASQLLDAGAEVVAILEASNKPPTSVEYGLRSLGNWGKMREALDYWFKIQKTGTPYHHSHVPVRIVGENSVDAVVVAQVDKEWHVVPGTERTLEADTLCLSYGLIPSTQLSRLAGCRIVYNAGAGGWVTWHDADQNTSVAGIYVAGEVAGIGSADVAEEEGRLAAIAAARSLGYLGGDGRRKEEQQARRRLAAARKFAEITNEMMTLKPALFDLATDETIVCRCEEITAGQLRTAIALGDATVRAVKMRTRAGMGLCQGRI